MKQMLVVFIALICVFMSGCQSSQPDKPPKVFKSTAPQIMADSFMAALDAKDGDALKKLFAPNTLAGVPDIDDQITALMSFYKGKSTSKVVVGSAGSSEAEMRDGVYVYMTIDPLPEEVVTDQAVYSFEFHSVAANDRDTDDVGLWYLMLTNESGEVCSVGDRYEGRKPKLSTDEEG